MSDQLQKLVFIGIGPFPEIIDIVLDINKQKKTFEVLGILDDNEAMHHKVLWGYKVLGSLSLAQQFEQDVKFVMGIGAHASRLTRYDIIKKTGLPAERYQTLISPLAKIFSTSSVGHGCIIDPGVMIGCDTVINDFCVIKASTVIGASNLIGEGALITPGVVTIAKVKLGSYCFIGAHSSIAEGKEIGPGALVSMATYVTKNVAPGRTAFGNPCKIVDQVDVKQDIIDKWESLKKEYLLLNKISQI